MEARKDRQQKIRDDDDDDDDDDDEEEEEEEEEEEASSHPLRHSHFEDYHKNYYQNNKNQGYCRAVINPKLDKFMKKYGSKTK